MAYMCIKGRGECNACGFCEGPDNNDEKDEEIENDEM